jgi:hypothetical protein
LQSGQSGNIRDALHKVLIEIIPRGILPALRVNNFWFKKTGILGILEAKGGSVCLECSSQRISAISSMDSYRLFDMDINMLKILTACTAHNFFGLFCTTVVEALLFRTVYWAIKGQWDQ